MNVPNGKSCRSIAMNLTKNGIPTPSEYAIIHGNKTSKISKVWSDNRIREIILNEVYLGHMIQGKMKKLNYKSKKNIRMPKENWKRVENTHEALISKELFIKANDMLNTRRQTRIKSHDFLLKGLIYCHECHKKMGCVSQKNKHGYTYYLRCNTYAKYTKLSTCTPHLIKMNLVEDTIINTLNKIINEHLKNINITNIIDEKINEYLSNNYNTYEIKDYEKKILILNMQIDSLYNDKLNNILSQDDFNRIYTAKLEERIFLQNKIKYYSKNNISNKKDILKKLTKKINLYNNINREILNELIDKIEIDDKKNIYIYFKFNQVV